MGLTTQPVRRHRGIRGNPCRIRFILAAATHSLPSSTFGAANAASRSAAHRIPTAIRSRQHHASYLYSKFFNPALKRDRPQAAGLLAMRSASASPPPPSSMRILCKVLRCSLLAASIELKLGTRAQTSRSRKPHTPAQTLPASLVLHNFGSFRFLSQKSAMARRRTNHSTGLHPAAGEFSR